MFERFQVEVVPYLRYGYEFPARAIELIKHPIDDFDAVAGIVNELVAMNHQG